MKQLNNIKFLLLSILLLLPTLAFSSLTLTVQINPDPVRQGEIMLVKYTITNTGATPLFGLILQSEFPAGLNSLDESLISDFGDCPSFSCEPGELLFWNLGNIGPGASMERTIPTSVANITADGTRGISFERLIGGSIKKIRDLSVDN